MPLDFQLSYRDILVAVAIVLFAYLLRVIVVFDRAYADPFFDPLPSGRDERTYMTFAERYEAGQWPTAPFRYQPGLVYYLVGIRALVGDSLGSIRLVTSLTGALACGFMIGTGWLLTGRRWGGYVAGLLLAIYPVAIFYSGVLLTEPLATFFVSAWLFFALWQRKSPSIWRSILIGLVLGLLAITRTNLLLLWFAGLLDSRQKRAVVLHAVVSFLFMALVIAPVTLWNMKSGNGKFQLIASTGMDEVYRANNRDATGTRSGDPAMETVDNGYDQALITDTLRDPLHFIELQLRKAGIYWSAQEPINNVDYVASGEAISSLLRAIPLDFGILTLLGWLGVSILFFDDRRMATFFTATNLLIFAGVMVIWIEGRLKQPAIVPLVATSAYLVIRLSDVVRARQWHTLAQRYAPAGFGVLAAFVGLAWARMNLPMNHPIAALPADVRLLDVVFDDKLHLLGWRTLPEWPAPERGWSRYRRSYVVELFWQVDEPVTEDYNVYLAYIDEGQRYDGIDRPIGGVSFRPKLTSEWLPGEIYGEIMGFELSSDIPAERSGDIRLGVYRFEDETIVDVPVTSLAGQPNALTLQRVAVFDFNEPVNLPDQRTYSDHIFGELIQLHGYTLPDTAATGDTILLSFHWEAVADVPADYTLFIHVVDEADQLAAQVDTPPRNNVLVTSTWPPDYPIYDEIMLTMPQSAGIYRVYVGLYHALTGERLAIDAPDNRLLLGEITVR
jgi:4-amino-4-deoxy-L-arabinose transferase-like glycosyltransferase